ncbi:MAG: helix-turn-helix domain-containing protein [Acidimicrobiia bacterium]
MSDRAPDTTLSGVRASATESGRINQKTRTRRALIGAAEELIAEGEMPTLAEVAERALVSKTTAYRYFASAEDLIEEVFFDRDFPQAEDVLADEGDDLASRVLTIEEAFNDALLARETAMRVIVRNALDMWLANDDDDPVYRVGRRMALIDAAIDGAEGADSATLRRLRNALALTIGPEAVIAARDVCGLNPSETRSLTRWATEALLNHALDGDG